MAQFKIAFQKTLLHEGNYSNDPSDLGGETYKGIARNIHSSWSGWRIIVTIPNWPSFCSKIKLRPLSKKSHV